MTVFLGILKANKSTALLGLRPGRYALQMYTLQSSTPEDKEQPEILQGCAYTSRPSKPSRY